MLNRALYVTAVLFVVGCPEPDAPMAPPQQRGPATAPAPQAGPGAPPMPEGVAAGAQDAKGSPDKAPPGPDGGPPLENVPPENPPPLGEGVVPLAPDGGADGQPTSPPPGEGSVPCGDGECDDAESADPNLCPRDCSDTPPPDGDWCGDGICDALEESKGDCTKDCAE